MTSKLTITRERLEKIKSWRETYGAGSNVMLPAEEAEELARMALAAMDSEPYGFTDGDRRGMIYEPQYADRLNNPLPVYRHAQPDPETEHEPIAWLNDAYLARGVVDGEAGSEDAGPGYIPVYREASPAQPAPVVPEDVLDALQKVARIRLDLNGFDGDRRGIADCLCDAEEALIEVVNRRAAMLQGAENAESRCGIQTAPALDSFKKNSESRCGNSPVIPDGSEWTNEQCLEFLTVAFRHNEISGDIEFDDIRLGVKFALSAAPQEVNHG
ncbi:hypothetical protein JAG56_005795 [Raoultella ornithinolytica]|nr:hypothetical protein [Raoultella ornithinolytica]